MGNSRRTDDRSTPDISDVQVQEMGYRQSCLGTVQYIRISTSNYRRLSWTEVWSAFSRSYPDQWAVQVFPPSYELVDEENVYHLFVLEDRPTGLSIHPRSR